MGQPTGLEPFSLCENFLKDAGGLHIKCSSHFKDNLL